MNPTAIDSIINRIQQKWGHQSIQQARQVSSEHKTLSTGFPELDVLTAGIPQSNITQLTGRPTSGMSTLAHQLMAVAQSQGLHAVFVDMGTSFDGGYARACGVDVDELILIEAQEESLVLDLLLEIVASRLVGLLVLNLLPLKTSLIDWRKVLPVIRESDCAIVLMTPPHVKNDLAGLRLQVVRQQWLEAGGDIVGCVSKITVERNRYGKIGESILLEIPFARKVER